jgi:hypothetical protein
MTRYDLHGITVSVESDTPAVLEALALRLADFESESVRDPPDVRLRFITGAVPPASPGRPVYDTPYGSLHYLAQDDVLSGTLGAVHLRCQASAGVAALRSPSFAGRDLYLATHPLATIALMELLERRGLFALHAGCLTNADGDGLLLSGPSGAGKSTLTMALADAGLEFLSDDVVFLARDADVAGEIAALGFADTIGLSDFLIERFPGLVDPGATDPVPGFPKRLGRIESLLGRPAVGRCVPRVIVFPKVTPGQPSTIEPIDPGEALLRLVPDVLLTDPSATQAHLGAIGALLEQVRCFEVGSGEDLERAAVITSAQLTSGRTARDSARAHLAPDRRCAATRSGPREP